LDEGLILDKRTAFHPTLSVPNRGKAAAAGLSSKRTKRSGMTIRILQIARFQPP
jgi:hypothetical protein